MMSYCLLILIGFLCSPHMDAMMSVMLYVLILCVRVRLCVRVCVCVCVCAWCVCGVCVYASAIPGEDLA